MNKEYGGYLPLELNKGNTLYKGDDVVALNSGRYAIVYALIDAGWNAIYLPYYICGTVEEAIRKYLPKVNIKYYHVSKNLIPENVSLQENEGILWVNYFGIQPNYIVEQVVAQFSGQIILDNTQAFFCKPQKDAYQVYSCRKFIGTCDGSYVIHENISHRPLPTTTSSSHAMHLLESLEYGTNHAYPLNKENEERLSKQQMSAMSPLTAAILDSADYENIKAKRSANMTQLHQLLKIHNRLFIPGSAPVMAYPFLCDKPGLRESLTSLKIYIPKLWQETSTNRDASEWEHYLSDHLCALPVDQRYSTEDMYYIADQVFAFIREH